MATAKAIPVHRGCLRATRLWSPCARAGVHDTSRSGVPPSARFEEKPPCFRWRIL